MRRSTFNSKYDCARFPADYGGASHVGLMRLLGHFSFKLYLYIRLHLKSNRQSIRKTIYALRRFFGMALDRRDRSTPNEATPHRPRIHQVERAVTAELDARRTIDSDRLFHGVHP